MDRVTAGTWPAANGAASHPTADDVDLAEHAPVPEVGTEEAAEGEIDLDAERARLRAEIAAANERILAARQRTEAREAAAREALRAEVERARRDVAELERRHQEAIDSIKRTAAAEVERILSEARRAASGAESLGTAAHHGVSTPPEGPGRDD